MKAFVTGATGFIGNHVTLALLRHGYEVRALVRPAAPDRRQAPLPQDVEPIEGDVLGFDGLRGAISGCQVVFHVAALYDLWSPWPSDFYEVNVRGTENVLMAARQAGVERIVYTSSVATIAPNRNAEPERSAECRVPGAERVNAEAVAAARRTSVGVGFPQTPAPPPHSFGDERSFADPARVHSHYKRSKIFAERVARDCAAQGWPVVIVNPSTPVGSGDVKPTPTGRIVLDFLRGRMPAFVDTGLNLIDVEDVAEGHLLALERGTIGQRYILGNENMALKEMLHLLAQQTGREAPRLRLPLGVALAAGALSELVEGRLLRRPPAIPLEGVRMAASPMFYDASRARRELGLPQTPVRQALKKSADWFQQHGYC